MLELEGWEGAAGRLGGECLKQRKQNWEDHEFVWVARTKEGLEGVRETGGERPFRAL